MHFPVAGIDVHPLVPPLVAFGISLFTSMGGVSGAFLLLPFQVSVLGYASPSVSATNQLFNVVAIPSGVWQYVREGRMVWPLAWIVVAGTLPGVLVGALLRVRYLPDPAGFKFFAGLVLLYIGVRLVRDLVSRRSGARGKQSEEEFQRLVREFRARSRSRAEAGPAENGRAGEPLPRVAMRSLTPRRLRYEFYGRQFDVSTPGLAALSLVVGIVGGVYGIGGGAIMAPLFVTFFGLPVYTVAGAALMGTFVTSVAGVVFYQAIAPSWPQLAVAPDYALGILFGAGGAVGMFCGARLQKRMPARWIKWILAGCILLTAARYILGYLG